MSIRPDNELCVKSSDGDSDTSSRKKRAIVESSVFNRSTLIDVLSSMESLAAIVDVGICSGGVVVVVVVVVEMGIVVVVVGWLWWSWWL